MSMFRRMFQPLFRVASFLGLAEPRVPSAPDRPARGQGVRSGGFRSGYRNGAKCSPGAGAGRHRAYFALDGCWRIARRGKPYRVAPMPA